MLDAVVVGSGPNGLAAALVLARAGLDVEVLEAAPTAGGSARTAELTLPGFLHDRGSAVHPMALASPFLASVDLAGLGAELLQPEVAYAHPLDGGRAALAVRDLESTAEGLGTDGAAWLRVFRPLVERWRGVVALALGDMRSTPPDLAAAWRFGLAVLEQAGPARGVRFRGEAARGLLAGVAAHAAARPRGVGPAGVAVLLAALAHAVGWPVPRGGSQTISDALVGELLQRGGRLLVDTRVERLEELPAARAVLLDVSPRGLLSIAGPRLPWSYAAWLRRYRYRAGAAPVHFALSGPVPWSAAGVGAAGTVHLGGPREQVDAAEGEVAVGRHADRPFVLVSQPSVVDPGRAPSGSHVLWTYAHVPLGSPVDVSARVQAQVERFAPGFGDLVLARTSISAAQLERENANLVGGDVTAGAATPWQLLFRPVPRWDPYRTPVEGVYLCSAATSPGPGVHGMSGVHAARRVLRQRFGIRVGLDGGRR
ncbi:NAD(P)/FAD-dependent oxidoreductase [uncultured Pseudokineococcus sp.]|uniref:phytoene desaturase family protein n=1 Tax=uncultured Pseudokineococcus sp. TaxID=1642928 RepID=UPI002623EFF9|nr:NAD(P)/FAD-dependent oxidoreductase [uncultured Pseudokineococcus sp.]